MGLSVKMGIMVLACDEWMLCSSENVLESQGRIGTCMSYPVFTLNPESNPVLVNTVSDPVVVKLKQIHFCSH